MCAPSRPPHPPALLCWAAGVFLTAFWATLEALTVTFRSGSHDAMSYIARRWARSILRFCNVRVQVHGLENLPTGGKTVLVANHESFFDILALLGHMPGHLRMVAKKELFYIPFLGYGMRAMGHIKVERQNRQAAVRDMRSAEQRLSEGVMVVVFAEGTRTGTGALLPFKKGAAVLAIGTQATVVPIAIEGSREVLGKGGFEVRPGVVHVHVLAPVPAAGLSYEDRAPLTGQLRQLIGEKLLQLNSAPPPW